MGPRLPARRPPPPRVHSLLCPARRPRAHSRPAPRAGGRLPGLRAPRFVWTRRGYARAVVLPRPVPGPGPGPPGPRPARPARPDPERSAGGGRAGGANMATVPVYCVCRLPYDVTRFMIECDACKDWFHGR